MPKFLIQAAYTAEGLKGFQKEKGSGRLAAAQQLMRSVGGSLESMHFGFGADHVILLVDLPDTAAAAAVSTAVVATGLATMRTTALLTVAEMDEALARAPDYRGPGT